MTVIHGPLPGSMSPVEAFLRLRDLPGAVLLESVRGGALSFVAADPFATLRASPSGTRLAWPGSVGEEGFGSGEDCDAPGDEPPLGTLRRLLARFRVDPDELPPEVTFPGGACGWLGYELGGALNELPPHPALDPNDPLLELGLYDVVLGWDHPWEKAWIVSTGFPEEEDGARSARAGARMESFLARLEGGAPAAGAGVGTAPRFPGGAASRVPGPADHPVPGLPGVRSTFTPEGYREAVERIRELILAGDIFQANLSQRFHLPFAGDPLELHHRLSRRHPSPYAALLETGDGGAVVSASPECFLSVRGRRVETRPIKGTAPRGADEAEDLRLARRLLESEKDRAENVMIVDLLRNDLSRVCAPGTVRAPVLCALESHPTVHHLVSTVEGELAPGRDALDLLEAAFPGGSITGAPKLRAMEILADLEPTPRGVYTGSVGWLGFDGDMELSIAIRTVGIRNGMARVHAGGGVVLDSDPDAEWRETVVKVGGILAALGAAAGEARRGPKAPPPFLEPALPGEEPAPPVPEQPPGLERHRVAVLDHRDSFVHNLARYLEELGARVRVFRADRASLDEIRAMAPTHLVLSPGPCTPREFPLAGRAVAAFAGRIPVLGVCLGHLCVSDALGGGWSPALEPRHGKASPVRHDGTGLFEGVPDPFMGALYHSLALSPEDVPAGFRVVARTDGGEVMAVEDRERRIWGLQLHPESVLTEHGRVLLANFLRTSVDGGGPDAPVESES